MIAGIWAESHPEFDGDPGAEAAGLSVDALRRQVTGQLKHPGFTLAVAHSGGTAIGFGYAFPARPTTGSDRNWWTGSPKVPVPNSSWGCANSRSSRTGKAGASAPCRTPT
ncbi:hypothetical protein [Streptomyces uncialis]|uniref:hypothetical protein n=1 Tax=Streptomyces uncialis TaxID=1048205 RepID=UPI00386873A5|nr:hypothetical protein OG268_24590 [Streptomyces uncialis]